jgi:hypothetical protein
MRLGLASRVWLRVSRKAWAWRWWTALGVIRGEAAVAVLYQVKKVWQKALASCREPKRWLNCA